MKRMKVIVCFDTVLLQCLTKLWRSVDLNSSTQWYRILGILQYVNFDTASSVLLIHDFIQSVDWSCRWDTLKAPKSCFSVDSIIDDDDISAKEKFCFLAVLFSFGGSSESNIWIPTTDVSFLWHPWVLWHVCGETGFPELFWEIHGMTDDPIYVKCVISCPIWDKGCIMKCTSWSTLHLFWSGCVISFWIHGHSWYIYLCT